MFQHTCSCSSNGDSDPAINSFTAQNWTSHLGFDEIEAWRPWTIDGKEYIGGYVTRYENNFDFLTIRGAGHMVPQYKPKVTFEFLSRWLKDEPWQEWCGSYVDLEDGSCKGNAYTSSS
jgi:carboxypeptidase C (cathepsin A)